MFLAELHAVQHARIILRIRLYAGKLDDLKAGEKLLHLVVESDLLDAAAAIGEQYLFAELCHDLRQLLNYVFAENQSCGCHVVKVLHGKFLLNMIHVSIYFMICYLFFL